VATLLETSNALEGSRAATARLQLRRVRSAMRALVRYMMRLPPEAMD
jgi:hypothetical protein